MKAGKPANEANFKVFERDGIKIYVDKDFLGRTIDIFYNPFSGGLYLRTS